MMWVTVSKCVLVVFGAFAFPWKLALLISNVVTATVLVVTTSAWWTRFVGRVLSVLSTNRPPLTCFVPFFRDSNGLFEAEVDVHRRGLVPNLEPCSVPLFSAAKIVNFTVSFWGAAVLLVAYVAGDAILPSSVLPYVPLSTRARGVGGVPSSHSLSSSLLCLVPCFQMGACRWLGSHSPARMVDVPIVAATCSRPLGFASTLLRPFCPSRGALEDTGADEGVPLRVVRCVSVQAHQHAGSYQRVLRRSKHTGSVAAPGTWCRTELRIGSGGILFRFLFPCLLGSLCVLAVRVGLVGTHTAKKSRQRSCAMNQQLHAANKLNILLLVPVIFYSARLFFHLAATRLGLELAVIKCPTSTAIVACHIFPDSVVPCQGHRRVAEACGATREALVARNDTAVISSSSQSFV